MGTSADGVATYQEYLTQNSDDPAAAFFELANQSLVRYRGRDGKLLEIAQDPGIEDSTGGIVWETSFLLATFLETQLNRAKHEQTPRVLEVGAGCGLLGLALAHAGCDVTLTETSQAMPNLRANVEKNRTVISLGQKEQPRAMQLSWDCAEERESCLEATGGDFDLIVGTDVVFAERLVEPLLETIDLMAGETTVIWLCLQERCPDAHAALLKMGESYFDIQDWSEQLAATPGCRASTELECVLLRMSPRGGGCEKKDGKMGTICRSKKRGMERRSFPDAYHREAEEEGKKLVVGDTEKSSSKSRKK